MMTLRSQRLMINYKNAFVDKVAKRLTISFLVITLVVLLFSGGSVFAKLSKERETIRSIVVEESLNLGLPVALALAVAQVESNFDANALSPKGARGVMQIMPATALGEYGLEADTLWNPRVNIRLGIHFLLTLISRYHGHIELALSYYNGGSAVGAWPEVKVIPATRKYVAKVKNKYRYYRRELWSKGYSKWMQRRQNARLSYLE